MCFSGSSAGGGAGHDPHQPDRRRAALQRLFHRHELQQLLLLRLSAPIRQRRGRQARGAAAPRHAGHARLAVPAPRPPVPNRRREAHPGGADQTYTSSGEQLVHKRAAPHPAAHARLLRQARWQEEQERLVDQQEVLARRAHQPTVHCWPPRVIGRRRRKRGPERRRTRYKP